MRVWVVFKDGAGPTLTGERKYVSVSVSWCTELGGIQYSTQIFLTTVPITVLLVN
jgi:hypothetical protein